MTRSEDTLNRVTSAIISLRTALEDLGITNVAVELSYENMNRLFLAFASHPASGVYKAHSLGGYAQVKTIAGVQIKQEQI